MKILLLIISFFSIYAGLMTPKMRLIHFEDEMHKAKFISRVVIENYDSNGVFRFRSLEFKDTINCAKSHLLLKRFIYHNVVDINDFLVASHPRINDIVLIVVDSVNTISLFAKQIGNDYRFWDPRRTTSGSLFVFNSPVKRLIDNKFHVKSDTTNMSCWDVCLLNKDSIRFYKGTNFRH